MLFGFQGSRSNESIGSCGSYPEIRCMVHGTVKAIKRTTLVEPSMEGGITLNVWTTDSQHREGETERKKRHTTRETAPQHMITRASMEAKTWANAGNAITVGM
jgi:hypothetical protein